MFYSFLGILQLFCNKDFDKAYSENEEIPRFKNENYAECTAAQSAVMRELLNIR